MRFVIVMLIALCSFAASAYAGDIDEGKAAYEHRDYKAAMNLLRPLADQGNAEAQFKVGEMYRNGQGVAKDQTEAYFWYGLAAKGGNGNASFLRSHIEEGLSDEQKSAAAKRLQDWKPADTSNTLTEEQKAALKQRIMGSSDAAPAAPAAASAPASAPAAAPAAPSGAPGIAPPQ
jgi:TPR repeat protein